MSRRRPPRCPSSCARKVGHPTKAEAETHAEGLKLAGGFRRVRIYRCAVCRHWFVTEEAIPPGKKRGSK